jgi:hypothetical protein
VINYSKNSLCDCMYGCDVTDIDLHYIVSWHCSKRNQNVMISVTEMLSLIKYSVSFYIMSVFPEIF